MFSVQVGLRTKFPNRLDSHGGMGDNQQWLESGQHGHHDKSGKGKIEINTDGQTKTNRSFSGLQRNLALEKSNLDLDFILIWP